MTSARGMKVRAENANRKDLSQEQKQTLDRAKDVSSDSQRAFFREVHELLGVSKAEYNSKPGLQKAKAYLEEHQIPRLLESLLARAALERPPDLRAYLVGVLTEMKQSKGRPTMGVFNAQDLEAMFDMWDMLDNGKVPIEKVLDTLTALQCSYSEAAVRRYGAEVDKATFMKIVRSALESHFASPGK